jgi:hypothetical protein
MAQRTARHLDGLSRLLLVWKGVLVILTIVAVTMSYLTMVIAGNSKCATLEHLGSFPNEGAGFLVPGAMSVILLIGLMIFPKRAEQRFRQSLAIFDAPVVTLGFIRAPLGACMVYGAIIGFIIWFAVVAGVTIILYSDIANYCR